MVVTEKKNTWAKSCKESAKRETEIFKLMVSLADDATVEDGDRGRIKKTLKQLRKEENEEYEARALLEAVQQTVNEAYARDSENNLELYRELKKYMYSWDRECGRPQNISDKLWQMMQSNDTKVEDFVKYFSDILESASNRVDRKCENIQGLGREK